MSYDENFMPTLEASANEATAAHQMELDALYRIGCQYDIAQADMALLCQLANVNVNEFMTYKGVPA